MRNLVILGASGSIGQSTLKVLRQNPGRWQVLALTAARSVDAMVRDCLEFSPRFAVMVDEKAASDLAGQTQDPRLLHSGALWSGCPVRSGRSP